MAFPRRRVLRLSLAAAAIAALTALTLQAPAFAADQTAFPAGAPGEAQDYASSTFHDAWDFSQASDLNLDPGPTAKLTSQKIAGGTYSFSTKGLSYFSPLWGGYPGAMPLGRDGSASANYINASAYKQLSFSACLTGSTPLNSSIVWFTLDGQKGKGGQTYYLQPGCHTYNLTLANNPAYIKGGKQWSGWIHSFRFAFNSTSARGVSFDFIRLYTDNPAASTLTWQSPDSGQTANLYWTTNPANLSTAARVDGGPVCDPAQPIGYHSKTPGTVKNQTNYYCSDALPTSAASTVDVSEYPAGTLFFTVSPSGVSAPIALSPRPNPTVTAPSAAGCGTGGKQSAKPLTWTFPKKSGGLGVLKTGNIKYSYKGGALQGVNVGPVKNDPWVQLTIPKGGIAGKTWRYLSVTEGYTGAFNLVGKSGGTMGRVVWQVTGQSKKVASQTRDLVTYSGKQTLNIDMGQTTAKLTEPEAKTRYPFAAAKPVSMLRWDPNENAGPTRHFQLYSVTLGQACAVKAGQAYKITWNDNGFVPGATANVFAVSGARTVQLNTAGAVPEAGILANSFTATTATLPKGTWTIRVDVSNAAGTSSASGATPIVRK